MLSLVKSKKIVTLEEIQKCISAGNDINQQGSDIRVTNNEDQMYSMKTALMYASTYSGTKSSLETVQALLDAGANINMQTEDGWTALMMASRESGSFSSLKTVQTLLDAGANVNMQNNDGRTALMMASRNSNSDSSLETVHALLDAGADHSLRDSHGWTALMMASRYSNSDSSLETVHALLDAGADVNIQNKYGWTALRLACKYLKSDSSFKTVHALLSAYSFSELITHGITNYTHQFLDTIAEILSAHLNTGIGISKKSYISNVMENPTILCLLLKHTDIGVINTLKIDMSIVPPTTPLRQYIYMLRCSRRLLDKPQSLKFYTVATFNRYMAPLLKYNKNEQ